MSVPDLQNLRRLALPRCFEFVAPALALKALHGTLPIEPGGVLRDGAGRAELLHFAPRRWLVPDPSGPLYRTLLELDLKGNGALVDVDGKWQLLRMQCESAIRILESSVHISAMLYERSCAALVLFDCPAVVARQGTMFDCWVKSSYAESLLSAIDRIPNCCIDATY